MHRIFCNRHPSVLLLQQRGRRVGCPTSRFSTVRVCAAQPCLVLSNDDGVESLALQSLAARLRRDTGHRVLVVAPSRNMSAASMGLTLRTDMELRMRPDLGPDTFALSGTPTDCMLIALDATKGLMRALDLHPIMALSGPNYGPNMGTDVLLSGTVGAARTAGLYGVPALASSSTSMDKASTLESAVDATLDLARQALTTLGGRPARNWPRNHIVVGGTGRRHVNATCEYESLPHSWVLDVEQVLVDAFQDGDVFLNLNVPGEWRKGQHGVQTTGLGLMFYKDSYLVSVPSQVALDEASEHQAVLVAAGGAVAEPVSEANGNGNGHGNGHGATAYSSTHGGINGNGNGGNYISINSNGVGSGSGPARAVAAEGAASSVDALKGIVEALAAGLPVVYNNAFDTRRTVAVDRSDVMALAAGQVSISTLQTWPEGHTLCLSDRVMGRALLSGHDGMPAWLQTRRVATR